MEGFPNRIGYLKPLYGLNVLKHLKQSENKKEFFNVGSTEKLNNVELIEKNYFMWVYVSTND